MIVDEWNTEPMVLVRVVTFRISFSSPLPSGALLLIRVYTSEKKKKTKESTIYIFALEYIVLELFHNSWREWE